MTLNVDWVKYQEDVWRNLLNINLKEMHRDRTEGVYVIRHGLQDPKVVYVGHGIIRERLSAHRLDPNILKYMRYGLFVTWAPIPAEQRNGVVQHLAQTLTPEIDSSTPECSRIGVNLPWDSPR